MAQKKHPRPKAKCRKYPTTVRGWGWTTPTREVISTPAGPFDPPEVVAAFRKEISKRERKLARARAKYPPTTISKGRGKKRRLVPNPDFTPRMKTTLHKHAFKAEDVRAVVMEHTDGN